MNKNEFSKIKINEFSKKNQKCKEKKQNNVHLPDLNESIKEKNTKKKTLDIIEETDFNFILQHIDNFNFTSKRSKLALMLLYITGIKLNILLKLKVSHLKALLKKKFFTFPLKNNDSLIIYILKENDKYLSEIENCSKTVIENKKDSDFLFTKKNEKKSLSRETLTRTLNDILKNAGESLKEKKVFSTHSFRISYIKNLSEMVPNINNLSQIIGHKNISSTIKYLKKEKLTDKEKKEIYENLDTK